VVYEESIANHAAGAFVAILEGLDVGNKHHGKQRFFKSVISVFIIAILSYILYYPIINDRMNNYN